MLSTNTEEIKCWKLPDSKVKLTNDELAEYVRTTIRDSKQEGIDCDLVVGTDSQIRGNTFHFATIVCLHKKGHGGIYFYNLVITSIKNFPLGSQKNRMFHEVSKAIETAQFIEEKTGYKSTIHIDASPPSKKEYTSQFSDQLHGYVTSCGFECVRKPESWASSSIGDKHAKQRIKKRGFKF